MMTSEELQQIKHYAAAGVYGSADAVISQLITELEYQMATNEQADKIIAGLRGELQRLKERLDKLAFGGDVWK